MASLRRPDRPRARSWWLQPRVGPLVFGGATLALACAAAIARLAIGPHPWNASGASLGALAALGSALVLLSRGLHPPAAALAASVAGVAAVSGVAALPGGMSPLAAATAGLLAVAQLASVSRARDAVPELLSVGALALCLLALAGHSGAPSGVLAQGDDGGISLATATGLALAGVGTLLLRPGSRLVSILSHPGPSGALVRRHFAAAAAAPVALAALVYLAEARGWIDGRWSHAGYVAGVTLVLLTATRFGARAVFLAEHEHTRVAGERAARREAERHAHHLEEQREALHAALGLRDEFLTVAAHELRTPLTVVALNVQALGRREGVAFDAKTHRKLHAVRRQLGRMEQMIDGLLDASRLAEGRLELAPERVDLAEVVRDVVKARADDLQASGSPVRLLAPPATGWWDRRRVAQVVDRLVENAVKYGRGRPIELRLERSEGAARLVVRDEGIGIPPDRRDRLFERYGRAVSERNYGGFGLGLWTAKQLVASMGGRIEVESEVDVGTTVTVELPVSDLSLAAARC